jgi:glycosyltransferase involved in cell wall biosynthesis
MRIGIMASAHFTIPPPKGVIYAPMDVAVSIGRGLAKNGHQVTLYAPVGTKVEGMKVETCDLPPLKQKYGGRAIMKQMESEREKTDKLQERVEHYWDEFLLANMFRAAEEKRIDILHIHPVARSLSIALSHPDIPVVYTLHDPISPWRAKIYDMFKSANQHYVSISDSQRKPAPYLNYTDTVYNGIDIDQFPFSEKSGDGFLWVGRLIPAKGPAEAIQAALQAEEKLTLIGPEANNSYWHEEIKPYFSGDIKYIGHMPRHKLFHYYQNAKALLMPINWEEPFGLVMIEAMACGTPVIAFRRGSAPEVVDHGKTGFIVDTVSEMADAMKKIDSIDRKACREYVEERFTLEKMVENYERLFSDILEHGH